MKDQTTSSLEEVRLKIFSGASLKFNGLEASILADFDTGGPLSFKIIQNCNSANKCSGLSRRLNNRQKIQAKVSKEKKGKRGEKIQKKRIGNKENKIK